MEATLLSLSGGVLVYLLVGYYFNSSGKEAADRRISKLFSADEIEKIHDEVLKEKTKKQMPWQNKNLMASNRAFENYLNQAGIRLKTQEFLYAWAGATFIPIILLVSLDCSAVTVVGVGFMGFVIPPAIVKRAKSKKERIFNKQLGESLIIVGNCIKSGYSFQQAMDSIARDMQPPISEEFAKAVREIQFGVKQEEALRHMVDRVQNKDLDLFVSAIVNSTQVGGNLSDMLDTISSTIKDRIKIRDEVRILTSSGRISGIIIGLLPVVIALFLMLVNPEYIVSFISNPIGKILIAGAVVLEAIGFTIVNRIVDIKY